VENDRKLHTAVRTIVGDFFGSKFSHPQAVGVHGVAVARRQCERVCTLRCIAAPAPDGGQSRALSLPVLAVTVCRSAPAVAVECARSRGFLVDLPHAA